MLSYDSIRPRQHIRRNRQADLLGGLEIDHKLKLHRLFDWQIGWLGTFEDSVHVVRSASELIGVVGCIRHKATDFYVRTILIHRREAVFDRLFGNLLHKSRGHRIAVSNQSVYARFDRGLKRTFKIGLGTSQIYRQQRYIEGTGAAS